MKRNEKNRPTLSVFVVEEREGADPYWNRIGAAFAHEDGKGYSSNLSVVPVNGRLVLREPKADEEAGR